MRRTSRAAVERISENMRVLHNSRRSINVKRPIEQEKKQERRGL